RGPGDRAGRRLGADGGGDPAGRPARQAAGADRGARPPAGGDRGRQRQSARRGEVADRPVRGRSGRGGAGGAGPAGGHPLRAGRGGRTQGVHRLAGRSAPGAGRRSAAGTRHGRRPVRARAVGGGDLQTAGGGRGRSAGDAERLSGAGEQSGGRRADAVRSPQHRAVPAPTCDGRHRLVTLRCTLCVHTADRPDPGASGRWRSSVIVFCRGSTKAPRVLRPCPHGRPRPSPRESVRVLVLVAPGQGAQTPGFLTEWLDLPGAADRVAGWSDAIGLDLAHYGTKADADAIRDTAVAQPLLVAAGLLSASALGELSDVRPGAVAGHSVGEITAAAFAGVLDDTAALSLVRKRGLAMADAAAITETGMAALLGGDPDTTVAHLEKLGLTPANINGAGQIVAAGTKEQLAAL